MNNRTKASKKAQAAYQLGCYMKNEVRRLVPYSSNRPSEDNQPFHRSLWLRVMRASNDKRDKSNLRKQLLSWHINLKEDKVPSSYRYRRVAQQLPNKQSQYPTLADFDNYFF